MTHVPPLKFDLLAFIEKGLFKCHRKFEESADPQELLNAKVELGVYQKLAQASFYDIDFDLQLKPDITRNQFYMLRIFEKNNNQLNDLLPRIKTLQGKVKILKGKQNGPPESEE